MTLRQRRHTFSASSSVSLTVPRPRIAVIQAVVFFVTAAIFIQRCEGSYQKMKNDGRRHVVFVGDDQLFGSKSSSVDNAFFDDDMKTTKAASPSSSSLSSIRTTVLTSVTSDAKLVDTDIQINIVDDHDEEHETLIFEGTFECQSDLVQLLGRSSRRDLLSFFQDPSNRHVVLKGGGNPVDVIPTTPRIFDEWTRRARLANSTPPEGGKRTTRTRTNHHRHGGLWGVLYPHRDQINDVSENMNKSNHNSIDEEVLAIHSDAAICPGLAIDAVSYTGCKLSVDPQTSLPRYEFTLLHDTYRAKGRRAMVWIFDRVTGADSNSGGNGDQKKRSKKKRTVSPDDDDVLSTTLTSSQDAATAAAFIGCGDAKGDHGGSRKTYALSRVTILPEDKADKSFHKRNVPVGGGGEQIQACRVCYFGHVRVACKLPTSFLHFLPIPKHKVEECVSKSIVKQLEKEGVRSVQQLADRLSKWTQPTDEAPSSKAKH